MAAQPQPFVTPEEYLERDRQAERKSEYMGNEVIPVAGASYRHSTIVTNLGTALQNILRGGRCRVHMNDLRVHIPRTAAFFYPDIVIVCGQPRFADANQDVLLNPTVVIEVQSPSTTNYDHGPKWAHYRRMDSLQAYVMVAQDEPMLEMYTRHHDVWVFTETSGLEGMLALPTVEAGVPLAEVYDGVDFAGSGDRPY